MPDVNDYMNGFGLKEGMIINNFKLTHINIQHIETVKYNEYVYPTHIEADYIGNETISINDVYNFYHGFDNIINKTRIIYTPSGRPYVCDFQWPTGSSPFVTHSDDFKVIHLEYKGHAKRVSKSVAENYK